MPVVFRFQFDDARISEVRSVTARARGWWFWPVVALGPLPMAVGLAVSSSGGPGLVVALYAFLAAVFGAVLAIVRWSQRNQLRKNAIWGREIESTLSDEGLHERSPDAEMRLKWSAVGRAIRYPDGVLLYRGAQPIWLAFQSIAAGTIDELDALLARHVARVDRPKAQSSAGGPDSHFTPPRSG